MTCCAEREHADRIMWWAIRRGLLALVKAIDTRYGFGGDDKRRVA